MGNLTAEQRNENEKDIFFCAIQKKLFNYYTQ